MSCGVVCRCGLDLALLWLWRRPAAIASIRPLAWEPPHVAGVAIKRQKKKKKKRKCYCKVIKICLHVSTYSSNSVYDMAQEHIHEKVFLDHFPEILLEGRGSHKKEDLFLSI